MQGWTSFLSCILINCNFLGSFCFAGSWDERYVPSHMEYIWPFEDCTQNSYEGKQAYKQLQAKKRKGERQMIILDVFMFEDFGMAMK